MPQEQIFQPMPISEFEQRVAIFNALQDFLIVTLTNSDVLFGGIFKWWREPIMARSFPWDGETLYKNEKSAWVIQALHEVKID